MRHFFSIFFLKCMYVNLLFFLFLAWYYYLVWIYHTGFPCGSAGIICLQEGDLGSVPGLGRSSGGGNSYPLQYSGLENSMDCIVHGVTKSQTWLSDFHFHFGYTTICSSIFWWMYNWIVSTFFMHGLVMNGSVLFQTYTVVSLSIYLEVFLEVLG